jgi:polysaccharide export outer membrane protein
MRNMVSKNQSLVSLGAARWVAPLLAVLFAISGCKTGQSAKNSPEAIGNPSTPADQDQTNSMLLREGDVVHIAFPSSANLDTTEQIRVDGKLMMPLIGEVAAAGLTPMDFQNELIKLYGPQLNTKQIVVTVQSASFPVYVTGAVLRPGQVMTDHPISALEAIMEAGGFDYTKANLKAVVVIRQGKDGSTTYTLNLKKVMQGGREKPFYLKPSDIVRVPEKFTWF